MKLSFKILGRSLEAHGVGEADRVWLEQFWHFPRYDPAPHPFGVRLEFLPRAPAPWPEVKPDWVEWGTLTLPLVAQEPVFWLGTPEAGARLTLGQSEAQIQVWGGEESLARAALFSVLLEALSYSGLICLHAAVAAQDGRATAFLGPSGTGKTTTLVHALRAGWQPVCEDVAWLEPQTRLVYGWDRGLRLLPDSLERLQGWRGVRVEAWGEGKAFVGFDQIGGGVSPVRLARVALLERSPDRESAWQPLSPKEAALALWQATGVPLSKPSRQHIAATLPVLLQELELKRLLLGENPSDVL